eukprot:SAG11_NODE_1511_length_4769_cov_3.389722_4_plen_57_part_00
MRHGRTLVLVVREEGKVAGTTVWHRNLQHFDVVRPDSCDVRVPLEALERSGVDEGR